MSEGIEREDREPAGEDRLLLLWRRIKHHRIAQWSVAYVALAYGIQHAIILTSESFEWSNAVARVSMLLLALGLPVAMTLAWYHGERASSRMSGAELTIIAILLAMSSVLFYAFVRPSTEIAAAPSEVQHVALATEGATAKPSGVAAARSASLSPAPAISLAVLPFVNLSSDKEQEFFSDGMTEEITSALAKIPDLIVIGRTSAFQYKGKAEDLRAIGQALSAGYLIEGSVRKAGDRVRITAQLIRADTGAHLWTDNYDRELKDVFAVQEDIAQAIAAALKVPLGLKQGDTLVSDRTSDLDSYDQYLRAKAIMRAGGASRARAIDILQSVVARDPTFAPAWGALAAAYVLLPVENSPAYRSGSIEEARLAVQSTQDKGEKAAREAIRLDARNAQAHYVLAGIRRSRGNWTDAEDLNRQALQLDANHPDSISSYANMLSSVGRLKEALRLKERRATLEPFDPLRKVFVAYLMELNGQNQAAISILEVVPADLAGGDFYRNLILAQAYAAAGRYAEAASTVLLVPSDRGISRRSVEDAARLLRTAPAKVTTPETLPVLEGELSFVYAYVGAMDRVLDYPERVLQLGDVGRSALQDLWRPDVAPVRKTERFKALMRKVGLVDYWRARGWPDLCHPVGVDDFVCD